jgi:ABC-type oligopeptide transport system substrate-binding subunit
MNHWLSHINSVFRQRLPLVVSMAILGPIVVYIAIVFSGFGGAGDARRDTVLNRGLGAEPESLDIHKTRTNQAGDVQRDLGEGLAGYAADGTLILAAAERMELSEDGLQYTFWLRPESRWSNGDKVTAQDFVYSFQRLVDPATAAFYAQQSFGDVVNATEIIAGEKPVDELAVEANYGLRSSIRYRIFSLCSLTRALFRCIVRRWSCTAICMRGPATWFRTAPINFRSGK